jgi:hypothetical protein
MVMDSEAQIIYVFGGRVVNGDWDTLKFSGLYSYNVRTSKWRLLQEARTAVDTSDGSVVIPPRYGEQLFVVYDKSPTSLFSGHSMVLDHIAKILYIFAGQREDKYLSDMYAYDIKTGVACEILSTTGGPEACFTPRAVIDPSMKEIYVISGLTRTHTTHTIHHHGHPPTAVLKDRMHNWVYKYDSRPGKWIEILKMPDQPVTQRPMPRFAHQVVYNPKTKAIYMHGGNGGGSNTEGEGKRDGAKGRLNDFWRMELKRYGNVLVDSVPSEIMFCSDQDQSRSSVNANSRFGDNGAFSEHFHHEKHLM